MGAWSQKLKASRCPAADAVIVAGGSGTRFGSDKLMAPLGGLPVLARTLLVFEQSPLIRSIVIAAREDAIGDIVALCRRYEIRKAANVVPGGETRLLSSLAGVRALPRDTEIAAIHDGARPLVTGKIVEDAVWAAYRHSAAVPAVPVRDTIKVTENGVVLSTPDRTALRAVQTPQCFRKDLIFAALLDAADKGVSVTDDCSALERIGGQIWLTEGSEENVKITTPLDLVMAEYILSGRNAP